MKRMAFLVCSTLLLLVGCSHKYYQWSPPAGASEVQWKRDRIACMQNATDPSGGRGLILKRDAPPRMDHDGFVACMTEKGYKLLGPVSSGPRFLAATTTP